MEPKSRHRAKAVVCFSKRRAPSEEGMGISSSTAGPKARGYRPAADERKPLFALANDELRAKFAYGGRSEISEQGAKRRSEKVSEAGPHRSLAQSISLSYTLGTKVRNLVDGTTA